MFGWVQRVREPVAWTAIISAALIVIFPRGFPNYDTIYYLLWGKELAEGMSPDYGAPLAPTPHPLYDLFGTLLSPLGDGAISVAMVVAYVSLALCAWLVYRLGREWFDSSAIGYLAAAVVLTSAPFLSNGLRAYIDIPYIALCLGALLIETRRSRAGWPVLILLALAGLLRPEAWLFSGAYVLWMAWDGVGPGARGGGSCHRFGTTTPAGGAPAPSSERYPKPAPPPARVRTGAPQRGIQAVGALVKGVMGRPELVVLAAAGPVIWIVFDWVTTGQPLYSLTGTRETVETLERATGPADVVLYGPRRLGEVLQWPGMIGAFLGVVLCWLAVRDRSRLGIAGAVLALAAFALMGAAGLAIIPRYTMLAAAILAVFVGAALVGWRLLPSAHQLRRIWQVAALVVAALYVIWLPNQLDLLGNVDRDLGNQGLVERDLEALVDDGAFSPLGTDAADEAEGCLPISAPNHRAVPRLAFWLDIRPSQVVSADPETGNQADEAASPGFFLAPARDFTIENFILDPGDPIRSTSEPPPSFELVAENRSWRLYSDCAAGR
jgi:hypothetical protein